MAGQIFYYEKLTATQIAELDRQHTLALMALSPLEVHGPHLPLGTDVLVAQDLQHRIVERAGTCWPETDFLVLPAAFVGADTVPASASVDVDSRVVYRLLVATGRTLATLGFHTLVLTDNHGGPRHQIAIEKAVRRLYRDYQFSLVAPFNRLFRLMVEQDAGLLGATGLRPGSLGDTEDSHAGTNETSLMLVVAPGLILPLWKTLSQTRVPEGSPWLARLRPIAGFVDKLGAARLARDLNYLGNVLGWIHMDRMPTYMGDPSKASAEAGEKMLEAHVDLAMAMLEETRAGNPPFSKPILWDLRFIEPS